MTAYPVVANGRTFVIYTRTLKTAIRCASVHVAFLKGASVIERVRRVA